MVHIWYFIDDICLPPANLTGTCHGPRGVVDKCYAL